MKKHLLTTIFCISIAGISFSQEADSIRYPSFHFGGVVKSKFEWATDDNISRFLIRNARLEVEGDITSKMSYKAKVDLNDKGDFKILDVFANYEFTNQLSAKFGQFSLPLFSGDLTDPGTMMFANRTFLAKYYVGSRDIGLMAKYKTNPLNIPTTIELGVFNGNSTNNKEWSPKKSIAARLTLGEDLGWRSTFKIYDNYRNTDVPEEFQHYLMYGTDLRYAAEKWKVETEVMQREDKTANYDLIAAYLQGAYAFPLNQEKLFKHIIPAARYDFLDQNQNEGTFDVSRLSLGLGFGLSELPFESIIRVDYEWYFTQNELDFLMFPEKLTSDKLTVELVYMF